MKTNLKTVEILRLVKQLKLVLTFFTCLIIINSSQACDCAGGPHCLQRLTNVATPTTGTTIYSGNGIASNDFIIIEGNFHVNNNCSFVGANIKLSCDAKIIIETGGSLTIDNCWLHSCDDIHMWDQITDVSGANNLTIKNGSAIEDAKIGLNLSNVEYDIRDSHFNKNYISIRLNSINQTNGTIRNINNNTFTSYTHYNTPNSPTNVLLLPYAGITYNAIEINECNNIEIGNTINSGNYFDNTSVGVYMYRSNASITKNVFSNINNFGIQTHTYNGPNPPSQAYSVYIVENRFSHIGSIGINSPAYCNIYALQNNFENCNNGILLGASTNVINYPIFQIEFLVKENDFIGTNINCIEFGSCNKTKSIKVSYNRFNTCYPSCTNVLTKIGIKYHQTGIGTLTTNLKIHDNTFNFTNFAIWLGNINPNLGMNTSKLKNEIYNNMINLDMPSNLVLSTNSIRGMRILNSSGLSIHNNSIYRPIINQANEVNALFGMEFQNAKLMTVDNNTMTNCATGYRITNFNSGTILHCNSFIDNYYGINAGFSNNFASMSTQGVLANGFDNEWNYPGITNTRVYGYSNFFNWYFRNPSGNLTNLNWPDGILTGCAKVPMCNGSFTCPQYLSNDLPELDRVALLTELLDSTIEFHDHQGANIWYRKEMVLEILLAYPDLLNGNDSLSLLLNSINQSPQNSFIKNYLLALNDMANGNKDLAMTFASSAIPSNKIEENIIEFINIYCSLTSLDLTGNQYEEIYKIACQDPFEGGVAVYFARAVLRLDEIEDLGGCNLRIGSKNNNDVVSILPNPAANEIEIISPKSNGLADLQFYSLEGKQVLRKNCIFENHSTALSVSELSNGAYILSIVDPLNGSSVQSKLVVIK